MLRLSVLFTAAYCLSVVFHELSHALTAVALGVPATVYNFYVDIDEARATVEQRTWIGVMGPAASLCAGLLAWFVRPLVRRRRAVSELRVLYVATFGISIGLGNLFSASFAGDISAVMRLFDVPMATRYAITMAAAVALCAFTYVVGRELRRWSAPNATRWAAALRLIVVPVLAGTLAVIVINLPMATRYAITMAAGVALCAFTYVVGRELRRWSRPNATRWAAALRLIVVPVLAGTLAVIVINLPMPSRFVVGWVGPTIFWAFAVAGVLFSNVPADREPWGGGVRTWDVVFLLLVVIVVRWLSAGISLPV